MNSKSVESLLEDCRSGDPSRQTLAIMELQKLEAYEAAPTLIELLASPEEDIQRLAVEALGWLGDIGSKTVGDSLLKMLNDDPDDLMRCELVTYSPPLRDTTSIY